jgi:pimeloyl-ACP methyl ester carboxylesterase
MYSIQRPSRSEFVRLRGLNMHLRHWGNADQPLLLLCHGWMDVGASFQFLVDDFSAEFFAAHHIVALDWRGYGLTDRPQTDCYWFPDYLADLDHIVDHLSPGAAIKLLGHSMGGNVVMSYAGVRPARVAKLINLEGFGMPKTQAEQAPKRYASWLDELKAGPSMQPYASLDKVAARLMKTNPRLPQDRADWLATHWAAANAQGTYDVLGDPAHKLTNPILYKVDEALAIWGQIAAPLLAIEGTATDFSAWWGTRYSIAEYHERLQVVKNVRIEVLHGAGHMLHHERSADLAALIEAFA